MIINDKTKYELRKNSASGMSSVLGGAAGSISDTVRKALKEGTEEIKLPKQDTSYRLSSVTESESNQENDPIPEPIFKPQYFKENNQKSIFLKKSDAKLVGSYEYNSIQGKRNEQEINQDDDWELVGLERMYLEDGREIDVAIIEINER